MNIKHEIKRLEKMEAVLDLIQFAEIRIKSKRESQRAWIKMFGIGPNHYDHKIDITSRALNRLKIYYKNL